MPDLAFHKLHLPPPPELGLPAQFDSYRMGQDAAIKYALTDEERVVAICAPTGTGKGLVAAVLAAMTGKRVFVLTGTKALQSQYGSLYAKSMGMADVRGQVSYPCRIEPEVTVADGPCHHGQGCQYLSGGCAYFDKVREAQRMLFVCTNYAAFFSQMRYSNGLGKIDILVLDEADIAVEQLASFLGVTIERGDLRRLVPGADLPIDLSEEGVRLWAEKTADKVPELPKPEPGTRLTVPQRRRRRELAALKDSIGKLAEINAGWRVWSEGGDEVGQRGSILRAEPVSPSDYVEEYLFKYKVPSSNPSPEIHEQLTFAPIPKIVLLSATLPRKEVDRICPTIPYSYHDFPSNIPAKQRQVIHIETAQMKRTTADYPKWARTIDQIVAQRLDRKGILHTTSYARRNEFLKRTRWAKDKGMIISHGSRDIEEAVKAFKAAKPPCLLVSPAMTRGYDFAGDQARYLIVGKVPWPPPSPIADARKELDPDYPAFEAMKVLMQEFGRAVRDPLDWAELLVCDDDWVWFAKHNRDFMTRSFAEAVDWKMYQKVFPTPPPLDWIKKRAS